MKDAGCRLLIVGYESGDPQVLKNIKISQMKEEPETIEVQKPVDLVTISVEN